MLLCCQNDNFSPLVLSVHSCSFYKYILVSITFFYKNRKQVQEVSPVNQFTILSPYLYPFLKQVQEVSLASEFC